MTDPTLSSDSIYHRLFAHPEAVKDLLENFLTPEELTELDLSAIRRLNTKFTAQHEGNRRRGDVVWEIPLHTGGSLFVLLILEFQSDIEEWMVLRLDVYTGLLYQQLVDERKLKTIDGLPPGLTYYHTQRESPMECGHQFARTDPPTRRLLLVEISTTNEVLPDQPDCLF